MVFCLLRELMWKAFTWFGEGISVFPRLSPFMVSDRTGCFFRSSAKREREEESERASESACFLSSHLLPNSQSCSSPSDPETDRRACFLRSCDWKTRGNDRTLALAPQRLAARRGRERGGTISVLALRFGPPGRRCQGEINEARISCLHQRGSLAGLLRRGCARIANVPVRSHFTQQGP